MLLLLYISLWTIGMFLFYKKLGNLFSHYYDDIWSGYDKWHMSPLEYRYFRWMAKNVWPIIAIGIGTVPLWIIVCLIIGKL